MCSANKRRHVTSESLDEKMESQSTTERMHVHEEVKHEVKADSPYAGRNTRGTFAALCLLGLAITATLFLANSARMIYDFLPGSIIVKQGHSFDENLAVDLDPVHDEEAGATKPQIKTKPVKEPVPKCDDHNSTNSWAEPVYEWYHYARRSSTMASNLTDSKNSLSPRRRRLLILQYSAFGKYAKILEATAPINRAYAKLWGQDMLIVRGTLMRLSRYDKPHCVPREERSRFNKVPLLKFALNKKNKYDYVLLLDADAMMYDFSKDVTSLLAPRHMLTAQRVHDYDSEATYNINNGVTLWNLHHPLTRDVYRAWDKACRKGIPDNRPYRGDQYYLHQVFKSNATLLRDVRTSWGPFYYRDGTVVKHFQRSDKFSWKKRDIDDRIAAICNATLYACTSTGVPGACKGAEYRDYSSSTAPSSERSTVCGWNVVPRRIPDPSCKEFGPRRDVTWDWHRYISKSKRRSRPRLLIGQYSGYGPYTLLLNQTAAINRAYAKKYRHDFVTVLGATQIVPSDGDCEPEPSRSMFSKIGLLKAALEKKDDYDQILILDADAMMYDFSIDVTAMLRDNETGIDDLLAAQGVRVYNGLRTFNINNGIVLWNLHHPRIQDVVNEWEYQSGLGIENPPTHGDQFYLQRLLKKHEDVVRAQEVEFKYENGTVAKHFVRPKYSNWVSTGIAERDRLIRDTIDEVCERFTRDCVAVGLR